MKKKNEGEFFYGCQLEEEEADRILGIKAELVAEHGEEEAEALYDGAREGLCNVLGNEYTHDFDGELFVGGLLAGPDDSPGRKAIEDHLREAFGRRLPKRRLALYRVTRNDDGEVIEFESWRDGA